MFESTKMNKSRLSHQAIDGKEVDMCVYGKTWVAVVLWRAHIGLGIEEKDERQYVLGIYCVLGLFWGLLPIHLLKSSRKTIVFILSYLIYL